jgi:hypothetical protein
MASETEYSNFSTVEEELTAGFRPAFVAKAVTRPMVWVETLTGQAKTKEFRKGGSVTASAPGEGTAPTKQELTDSVTQITAVEVTVWTELTRYAQLLVGDYSVQRLIQESSSAIARKWDQSVLALAASISNTAGTSGVALDEDAILAATYLLDAGNALGSVYGVVSAKGALDLRTALKDNAAVSYNSVANRGLENANYNEQAYIGSLMGIPFFKSTQVYNDGTDDFGMLITPYGVGVTEANGGELDILEAVNPSTRITGKSLTMLFGIGIVEQAGLVRLRHVD